MTPLLPKLKSVSISRFEPLFKKNIEISIPKDLFLVAGGNGLGKTTIVQAIVYCIAGELDIAIEKDKSKRWRVSYFHGRIDDRDVATVETKFEIADTEVVIRRGFKSKVVLELSMDGETIKDQRKIDSIYANFITQKCGYQSFDDFRFVIHKLCYLPETRPDLAWDIDTQIRILMTLFSDIIDENQFRIQRKDLKELDSKRRHIKVAINKANDQIEQILSYDEDEIEEDNESDDGSSVFQDEFESVREKLSELYGQRLKLQKKLRKATRNLSNVAADVEGLESKLTLAGERFFLNKLSGFERKEARLAIHKLFFRSICPACGSNSSELHERAKKLAMNNCCPLCGADEQLLADIDLPQLEADLTEKASQRIILEKEVLKLETLIDNLNNQESLLQTKIDKYRISTPVISESCTTTEGEEQDLKAELKKLKRKYKAINARFNKLRDELDSKYASFHQTATARLKKLKNIYQSYATSFLGVECQLVESTSGDRFLDLNLFVPSFDNKIRRKPQECSEAQRFFLDIAFRLALIDLTAQLSQSKALFICETPESSLDISYIENVASMFIAFSDNKHTILLTTNIQPGGLAKPILRKKSKREKKNCILNLLNYGQLSDVQRKNIRLLNNEYNAILN